MITILSTVPLSELKNNLGKYVDMADSEDILVTRNGKVIAKLTNARTDKVAAANALFGLLPSDADLDKAREERLK